MLRLYFDKQNTIHVFTNNDIDTTDIKKIIHNPVYLSKISNIDFIKTDPNFEIILDDPACVPIRLTGVKNKVLLPAKCKLYRKNFNRNYENSSELNIDNYTNIIKHHITAKNLSVTFSTNYVYFKTQLFINNRMLVIYRKSDIKNVNNIQKIIRTSEIEIGKTIEFIIENKHTFEIFLNMLKLYNIIINDLFHSPSKHIININTNELKTLKYLFNYIQRNIKYVNSRTAVEVLQPIINLYISREDIDSVLIQNNFVEFKKHTDNKFKLSKIAKGGITKTISNIGHFKTIVQNYNPTITQTHNIAFAQKMYKRSKLYSSIFSYPKSELEQNKLTKYKFNNNTYVYIYTDVPKLTNIVFIDVNIINDCCNYNSELNYYSEDFDIDKFNNQIINLKRFEHILLKNRIIVNFDSKLGGENIKHVIGLSAKYKNLYVTTIFENTITNTRITIDNNISINEIIKSNNTSVRSEYVEQLIAYNLIGGYDNEITYNNDKSINVSKILRCFYYIDEKSLFLNETNLRTVNKLLTTYMANLNGPNLELVNERISNIYNKLNSTVTNKNNENTHMDLYNLIATHNSNITIKELTKLNRKKYITMTEDLIRMIIDFNDDESYMKLQSEVYAIIVKYL